MLHGDGMLKSPVKDKKGELKMLLRKNQRLLTLVFCIVILFSIISLAAYEPFKVKLNLFERLVVMGLLPKEENFLTLVIIRNLQMELAATEAEAKLAGLVPVDTGGTRAEDWLAVPEKEIIFGDIAKGLVVDALKKLDETKKLTNDYFTIYEKFVLEKKVEEPKVGE